MRAKKEKAQRIVAHHLAFLYTRYISQNAWNSYADDSIGDLPTSPLCLRAAGGLAPSRRARSGLPCVRMEWRLSTSFTPLQHACGSGGPYGPDLPRYTQTAFRHDTASPQGPGCLLLA